MWDVFMDWFLRPGFAREEKRRAWWERMRRGGVLRFSLVRGLLGYSLPMTVVSTVTDVWQHGAPRFRPFLWLFWIVVGWIMGLVIWEQHDRKYPAKES